MSSLAVSVVIPTYRRPRALARLLSALALQIDGHAGRRVIVVNDGSHDRHYAAIMARFDWASYVRRPRSGGPAIARNEGATRATQLRPVLSAMHWLVFIDDDCVPPADWLDRLDAVAAVYPHLAAISGIARPMQKQRPSAIERFRTARLRYPLPQIYRGRIVLMPSLSMAVRADWFARLDGFAADLSDGGEDLNFTYRLAQAGGTMLVARQWQSRHDLADTPIGLLRRYRRYGYGAARHRLREGDASWYGLPRDTRMWSIVRAFARQWRRPPDLSIGHSESLTDTRRFDRWDALIDLAYCLGGRAALRRQLRRSDAASADAEPSPSLPPVAPLGAGETLPTVTVIVTQRERYSFTRQSLASLYAHAGMAFELVYVDGASPAPVRRWLEQQAGNRGFTLLRHERPLATAQARRIGLERVRTPYVALVENDIVFEPGWLLALMRRAVVSGAAAVGPLYLIDHRVGRHVAEGRERAVDYGGQRIVHMAGGEAHFLDHQGRRIFREHHYFCEAPLAEAAPSLRAEPTELLEFHCLLAQTEQLRLPDTLDEQIPNGAAHLDLCLTLRQRGLALWLEPQAVAINVPDTKLRWMDLRLFMFQWNERSNIRALARFREKWGLGVDDPFIRDHARFLSERRKVFFMPLTARLRRVVGARLARRIETGIDRMFDFMFVGGRV